MGASLMWALWAEQQGGAERDRLDKNLAWLADHRTDYVRWFASVGGDSWADRAVDITRPDYRERMSALASRARRQFGIRSHITCIAGSRQTDTSDDRQHVVEHVIAIAKAQPEDVFAIEIANEWWSRRIPLSELRRLAKLVQTNVAVLNGPSAPQGDSEAKIKELYEDHVGTLVFLHPARDMKSDGHWRSVRQAWREQNFEVDGVADAYLFSEPKGEKSSVSADSDPTRLALTAVMAWLCGIGGYTVHASAGIRGGGIADREKGRAANYWEVEHGDATFRAIDYARSLLDQNLPNWAKVNGDSSRAPLLFRGTFKGPSDQGRPDVMRVYWATIGGQHAKGTQAVGVALDISGTNCTFEAPAACHVDVHDLAARAKVRTVRLAKGDRFTLARSPQGVLMRGLFV